jgi:hypothetical protein
MERGPVGETVRVRVPSGRESAPWAGALVVVAVVSLCLLPSVGAGNVTSAPSVARGDLVPAGPSPWSWNNGVLQLSFSGASPAFTVTALQNQSVTATQTLSGLAELNANDSILSFASFTASRVAWSFSANTSGSAPAIVLSASVPVFSSAGEWESGDGAEDDNGPIGAANVSISFALNSSVSANPWSLSYTLNVSHWPWLHAADSVGVEVRSNATAASDYWVPHGSNRLDERSRAANQSIASFAWGSSTVARYPGGRSEDGGVGSYRNFSANGSHYLVRLEFVSVSGGYTALSYDPWIALTPATPNAQGLTAWALSPTSGAILAGAGAGTLALALVVARRRVRPESDL